MTKQELNRDVKRLWNNHLKCDNYDQIEKTVIPEFKRLYGADKDFKYLNRDNILRIMVLNRKYNIIPFHRFGLMIDENNL